jgi:hemoglobin
MLKTKLAAVASVLLVACGGGGKANTKSKTTVSSKTAKADKPAGGAKTQELYDRLGGQRAIVAVVDEFIGRVAADKRINQRFANTDIPQLKTLLVEFVCMATGGPCRYSGRDMETSHAGMELVDEEFTALVEDLAATLDQFKVPATEKNELLGALGPLAPRMVVTKDKLHPVDDKTLAKATVVLDKIKDPPTKDIMIAAIAAAKRGQRNYADQLFGRVEIAAGAAVVASAAPAFRTGAPPRVETPIKQMPTDTPPQPKLVGSSDEDSPSATQLAASLKGTITVDGKPLDGVGLVQLYPISKATKTARRTPKQRVMEQRGKKFAPHLLAVPPGSTVSFPNFDSFYHNVFSGSSTQPFDLGLFKNGQSRDIKFDKPGLVRLGCNVHANMAAFVFVIDAPNYVPVDGAKEFAFKSLDPGKYRAVVWSERSARPMEQDIKITDGTNTITFDVKGDAEKGPSKDKFGQSRQPTATNP